MTVGRSSAPNHLLAVSAIVFLSGLLGSLAITPGHSWGGDFAGYILQAESLLEGRVDHYARISEEIITRSDHPVGPVLYPWGFPVSLTPVLTLFDRNIQAMKYLNLIFYMSFLIVLSFLLKPRLKRFDAYGVLFLFALCPPLLGSVNYIMSDILFLTLSTLSLVLIDPGVKGRSLECGTYKRGMIAAALIFCAYATRANGILLLVPLAMTQLTCAANSHRHRNSWDRTDVLKAATPIATACGLIAGYAVFVPTGAGSHLQFLSDVSLTGMLDNLRGYAGALTRIFLPLPFESYILLLTLPALGLGIVRRWRRDSWLFAYAAVTVILYLVWPFYQGLRFLFPIIPIYVYFTVVGIRAMVDLTVADSQQVVRHVLLGCGLTLCVAYAVHWASQLTGEGRDDWSRRGPYAGEAVEMFEAVEGERVGLLVDERERVSEVDCYVFHKDMAHRHQLSGETVDDLVAAGEMNVKYENSRFALYEVGTCSL